MSMVHIVRRALAKLRYPAIDANGNLHAQITPRTGTLAELLTVADAGNGELATATDSEMQVMYQGLWKMPFTRGPSVVVGANLDDSVTSIAAATWIPVPLVDALQTTVAGVVVGGVFVLPSWINFKTGVTDRAFLRVEMNARFVVFSANPGTTYFTRFEARVPNGTWEAISKDLESTVDVAPATAVMIEQRCDVLVPADGFTNYSEFRMMIKHDGAVAEGSYAFSNFGKTLPVSLVVTSL